VKREIKKNFEMYDTNGDGKLDLDEMKLVSKGLGLLLDDFGLK
jgi:Ca2+-binding EF-hand superfamily protein